MKNLLLSLIFGLSIPLGGCTVNQIPQDQTAPTFESTLLRSAREVKSSSTIGTSIYILSLDDTEKRIKAAKNANTAAKEIKKIVENGVSVDLKTVALDLILKDKTDEEKQIMTLLFNSILASVELQLPNFKFELTLDESNTRQLVLKTLVNAALDGVIETTSPLVN